MPSFKSSARGTLVVVAVLPALASSGDLGERAGKWFVMRRATPVVNAEFSTTAPISLPGLDVRSDLAGLRNGGPQRGVSLMTLWQLRHSSVSLQAGKHGEPTLRWSSRVMSHGEATHGLLDDMLVTAPAERPR